MIACTKSVKFAKESSLDQAIPNIPLTTLYKLLKLFEITETNNAIYRIYTSKSMKKYDIFISYRHEGGFDTAKHLNDLLTRDGYRVSFDIDTLRSGDFDTQLYERIDNCKDFILIVDEHAFDRTIKYKIPPQKDWLRCELARALEKKKNIIPIFLSGVKGFPNGLPKDISGVVKKNGPEYNRYYFNDFYRELKKRFLHTNRRATRKRLIYLLFTFIIIFFVFYYKNHDDNHYYEYQTNTLSNIDTTLTDTVRHKTTRKTSKSSSDNNDSFGLPPAPKYTEAKITIAKPEGFDEECSYMVADKPYIGYIVASEEIDDTIIITTQEQGTRAKIEFYINSEDLSNGDRSWLPYILVEGNKVKIEYYYSGQGGYRYILSMENLFRE